MSTVNIPPGVKPVSDSGVQPHILVVDDARDIREPLVRYLRESGYRASAADGAQAARRLMRTSAIDLVILDIMMPGEDGLSLCRSIRENSGIPVIMLTARGDELDRIVGRVGNVEPTRWKVDIGMVEAALGSVRRKLDVAVQAQCHDRSPPLQPAIVAHRR